MPTKSGGSTSAAAVKSLEEMRIMFDLQAVGMPREKCLWRRSEVRGEGSVEESISLMKAVVRGTLRYDLERRAMNESTEEVGGEVWTVMGTLDMVGAVVRASGVSVDSGPGRECQAVFQAVNNPVTFGDGWNYNM